MDEKDNKHYLNNTDDELSLISNKRFKSSPIDENTDPSFSTDRSDSTSYRYSNTRSISKSSPLSALTLGEMGLGVLDSDESNQSSLIGNAIASLVQPSPALSTIPSESSNYSNPTLLDNFGENEPEEALHGIQMPSSDLNSSPILLTDSTSTQSSLSSGKALRSDSFKVYQDSTPADLVPCSRTDFRGIIDTTDSTLNITLPSSSSTESSSKYSVPEGRAIRNTSMKKFRTDIVAISGGVKHKGRSPLAAIDNATCAAITNNDGLKKPLESDDSFFMYQRRDPRHYTGEDNFAKLSDEILLSIFKWLPKKALGRCGMVNHRFYRVTQDESLWTRLDLAGKTIQPHALGRILQRGVIILRLAQGKIFTPIFHPASIQKDFYTKLQFLDLSMAVISPASLAQLFSKCRQLRKLSLEYVPVSDAVCKAIALNRKLEVLNLAMSSGITVYGIRKLLSSLKSLHLLNM